MTQPPRTPPRPIHVVAYCVGLGTLGVITYFLGLLLGAIFG